jgi:CHAT domain-containing protein
MATQKDQTAREYVFRVSGPVIATSRGRRVEISAQRGQATASQTLRAVAGQDVVELSIAGGPTLRLHPANAELLLRSQQGGAERTGGSVADGLTIEVPSQLAFAGPEGSAAPASRGLVGRLVLKAIEVVAGPVTANGAKLTAALAVQKLESAVAPGVHRVPRAAPDGLPKFSAATALAAIPASAKPILVLVHGTFSSTAGTFSKLWQQHPELVEQLYAFYGDVYALDHCSVSEDPISNALELLRRLPAQARVHLVTHSRGGLVAEALARAMRSDGQEPYDATDFALLRGPAYAKHVQAAKDFNQRVKTHAPRIERIVRVAAPARGTVLASGRLDAYLSVLEWGLTTAGIPVLPELVDFIGAVARERQDPTRLPGVEAMIPGRPVMQVLTRPDLRLDGELRIVAGDVQGDSVLSWLKVLLTDAFYLTEHDLVVNTNSMYGGTPRSEAPSFVFERGSKVNHFSYFGNDSSAQAIVDGLTKQAPMQYRPVGPMSWDGKSSDGVRAVRKAVANTGQRPALFVLPGIMGSHLKVDGRRVWASPTALFFGGLKKLRYPGAKVEPEEPMDRYFGDLMEDLSDTYDVIPFAFDWRQPIEASARLLAAQIDKELHVRAGRSDRPVRILAHSMGGVVTRAVELEAPDVWARFVAQDGARIVLAGTPNRGAYAPMLALSAMHPLVDGVEAIDTCTSWKELKAILGDFPGLMQLQWLDPEFDLTRQATWKELERHHRDTPLPPELWHEGGAAAKRSWGIPSQDALDKLRELRQRLDARLPDYARLGRRLVLVAGSAEQTIAGLRKGPFGIEFLATEAGDGTVPWDSLRLPGVNAWRAGAEHGDLLRERSVFRAYRELLDSGSTTLLPPLEAPGTRARAGDAAAAGPAVLQVWRGARVPYAPTPGEVEAAALGAARYRPPPAEGASEGPELPFRVQVLHGDLKHVAEPLLVGHYRSELLTGSEKVLDRWLDGTLQRAVNLGAYVSAVGEQRIFVNRRGPRLQLGGAAAPKPEAVIVAGLGDEDDLTVAALRGVIAQAVIAWVQHCVQNRPSLPPTLELASLLLASGGIRIDVADSALAIVQGVREANRRLADQGLPTIENLSLVELYGDRASMAHTAIARAARQIPEAQLERHVRSGQGGRRRPVERGYRGTDYDRVHVTSSFDDFSFSLHTGRARGESRARSTQRRLVDRLLADAAQSPEYNGSLAHALYNMVIPLEMRAQLSGAARVQWSLDLDAARIPWEYFNDRAPRAGETRAIEPLALRVSMVRELRLGEHEFRHRPIDNRPELNVLVVGEPKTDPARYAPLPGALEEAEAVGQLMRDRQGRGLTPTLLAQPTAVQLIEQLYDRPWRIIHVAGHGDVVDGYGGVVLDNEVFLGASEIQGLATVPELVFINCCHIGRIDATPRAGTRPRQQLDNAPLFAANLARELIGIGVRCVVAAGWAVNDDEAMAFARSFYAALLDGRPFGDAVREARRAAWNPERPGTTWAAYQCYGDPGWTLRGLVNESAPTLSTPALPATPTRNDLTAALLEIETDAQDLSDDPQAPARRIAKLAALEQREGQAWPGSGGVAESFARAWSAVGDFGKAAEWYERAVNAPDASATIAAHEQYANVKVRRATVRGDVTAIRQALGTLDQLIAERPTVERLSLRGSAHKRLAMVALRAARGSRAAAAARRREALRHLAVARDAYRAARDLAVTAGNRGILYPPLQWACMLLLEQLVAGRRPGEGDFGRAMAEARVAIGEADRVRPDFWSAVAPAEWRLYEAVAAGKLDEAFLDIGAELELVHERDASPRRWASVSDTLEIVALAMWGRPALKKSSEALYGLGKRVRDWCAGA